MKLTAYAHARRALCENTIEEYEAGVAWETPEYLRLNDAVAAAKNGVPGWAMALTDRVILRQLRYWRHVGDTADYDRPLPLTLTTRALTALANYDLTMRGETVPCTGDQRFTVLDQIPPRTDPALTVLMQAARRLPRDRASTCIESTLRCALGYERTGNPEFLTRLASSALTTFRARTDPADQEALDTAGTGAFPPIVCLCGSTRFYDEFRRANLRLTLAGQIVLSIGCDTKSDADLASAAELGNDPSTTKTRLDELHKRKIDLADYVLVLNVGGYIGDSTRSEIAYALDHAKPVRYLDAPGRAA
jgi:hypothetical protein